MKLRWITLITVLVIITGALLYLKVRKSKDFEPLIKEKLAKLVTEVSNGLYKLDVEHIEIDITTSSITARNILLMPDSTQLIQLEKANQLGNDIFTISLKQINLEGLSPLDLIDGKNIHLTELKLDSPEIVVEHKKRNAAKKDTGNLFKSMKPMAQSYKVDQLLLNNIRLTINDLDKKRKITSFKNLSAHLSDIQVDSSVLNDSTRFLFAKDAVIYLKGYTFSPGNKKYNLDIDSVALRPQEGVLNFFNLRLKPIGTRDEFSAKLKYMDDRYDIHFKQVSMKNVNWFDLLSENGFYGDEMKIKGGYINVYDDRRLPSPKSKLGKYPHQLLMRVKFPLYVTKIRLDDIDVIYEEMNPKTLKVGRVEFKNVTGEIENITNIPERIEQNHFIKINAAAKLMNEGALMVRFNFDMNHVNNGVFTVDAVLEKMNGTTMNKITEPLALLKINSLVIDKLDAHISGTDHKANGKISFAYHDLNVDILKKDDEGKVKKRGLISFIANKFVIHKSSEQPAKVYSIEYPRDQQRSFFNLIWKTIMEGIKKTVK